VTRPSRPRRLAAVAAALALALAAGACDTSPVAASVNGQQIKQTALNLQVRLQTANKAYVARIDQNAAANAGNISVTGDAPGTYSTRFVAGVLTGMIQSAAVHQRLASTGRLPGSAQLAAARALDQALFGSTWFGFPQAFRDQQVEQDAEHAQIEPDPTNVSSLQSAYGQVRPYLFSQVCTRTIAVTVRAADGSVDFPASLAAARTVVARFGLSPDSVGGDVACYDGAGLESQGAAFFNQVLVLAPGHAAAPQRTSFGYQVVAVDSRRTLPLDDAVRRAIALAIAQLQASADPAVTSLARSARVTVDPAYGTWSSRTVSVTAPSPLGANSTTTP
jgi:hypothetical protein